MNVDIEVFTGQRRYIFGRWNYFWKKHKNFLFVFNAQTETDRETQKQNGNLC